MSADNGSARLDFRKLFEASPNAYVVLDRELTIVDANEAYLQATGRDRETLLGRHMFEAFPGDPEGANARRLKASFERVLSTGEPDSLALIPYAIPRETNEGTRMEDRYWSATHTPLFDENGEVVHILQHTTDVTELYKEGFYEDSNVEEELRGGDREVGRRDLDDAGSSDEGPPLQQVKKDIFGRAEEVQRAYWESEEERARLRRLFDQAPGFMTFLRGPDHVFEMANDAYYQVVGRRDIIGKPIREALPEVAEQGFLKLLDRVYESGEPYVGRDVEVQVQKTPGEELDTVYVDFVYYPVTGPDGEPLGIFVQGHDVTEKKKAKDRLRAQKAELEKLNETLEERVEQRTRQVRELTSQVTRAEQRERERVARLLHENLQQRLHGSQVQMATVREELRNAGQDALAGRIEEMEGTIKEIIQTTRQLSVGLSPPILESEGLTAALEWLQSHMEEMRGLTVEVSARGEFRIEEEMRVLLFQIARDLLENVDEHAGVRCATLTLRKEDGDLLLRVRDQGEGVDPDVLERLQQEEGFGLMAARHRVRLFGGDLEVHSTRGEGTVVTVRMPMEAAALPADQESEADRSAETAELGET